jgi:lysophospholipase L1-like esterase
VKNSRVLPRISAGVVCLSLSLMLYALITSQSADGQILGRWSVSMGLLMLVLFLAIIPAALLLSGSKTLRRGLSFIASRTPEFTAGFLLAVPPVLCFLIWFLFSIPLLERKSFVTGALLLSLAPGLLISSLFEPRKLKAVLAGTAVMVLSLCIAVALADAVLREVMPESIFNPRFGLRPYQTLSLEVDLPGVNPGGTLSTNMWGLRGEDPPDQWNDYLTIVTVGGSTTADYYLDDTLTWSHILESRLRDIQPLTWVGNGGIPRHSAETHSLFVREVLSEIKPDVALFLVGVNDMGPFLRGSSGSGERLPDSGAREELFANSMVLQFLYKLKKVYIDGAPVVSENADPIYREVPMEVEDIPLPDDLHDMLDDPGFYRHRIQQIISECRTLDITPVFMTQPLLYEDNEHWRGVLETTQWLEGSERPISAAVFSLMLQTLNEDLIDVCIQEGVAVFDLASEIPHSEEYFYDCMHLTEAGALLVGEKTALFMTEYLTDEGLLQQ